LGSFVTKIYLWPTLNPNERFERSGRRSFDNAHGRCASGSKKIADSAVKIGPLADSSWINLKKLSFFVSFFLKKRNAKEKKNQQIALL
jgi:hypothetical protein